MSEVDEPVLILIGSTITLIAGGIAWLCKNKCRNQTMECNSGCCKFHSDSSLRQTIRDEIQRSKSDDIELATD